MNLFVEDEGPGIAKPSGSGIGLALSRQIAEAHGGSVSLENRAGAKGCEARICLPLEG